MGLIDLADGQYVGPARAELTALGVTEFGVDRMRHVGRGVRDQPAEVSQLCGHCARGKVAIATNGDVWPCVFSRWMSVGNVRQQALVKIIASPAMSDADAATLYCYSLLVPATAKKVYATFAEVLNSHTGRVAQLCVIARMLRRVDDGDYPDLAAPLVRHAHGLLAAAPAEPEQRM